MSVLRKQGEKILSEFIEDDFISALETELNRTKYYRDRLVEISRVSQADENELGYDGVLTTVVPFYVQFKRSDFYTPKFTGHLLTDRQNIGLPHNKGFFAFELLKKDNSYKQHNTMFELSKSAKAAYVAPLFFKKKDLAQMKSFPSNYLPAYFNDIEIFNSSRIHPLRFQRNILFKKTVTIPPHSEITDNETSHHYTYCRDLKIGFHSDPINLENNDSNTLYYFLLNILAQEESNIDEQTDKIFSQLPNYFGLEQTNKEFENILKSSIKRVSVVDEKIDLSSLKREFTIIDRLLIIEDLLYQYFGIRQFIKYEKK